MTVLSAEGISVTFGGVHALAEVSLSVARGAVVGLIGPNGAGKTTFIDAITGFVPYRGRVLLGDRDLSGLRPHARARQGLTRTWQTAELFDDLTVRENLAVAVRRGRTWPGRNGATAPAAVDDTLALLGIGPLGDTLATDLSLGQRKLVGVARAFVARPRLICLDEPAAGLDTTEATELAGSVRAIADTGTSVILVDHDMDLVMSVCDHLVVLEFGAVLAAGTPAAVSRDRRVVCAYLGESAIEDHHGAVGRPIRSSQHVALETP